MQGFPWIDTRAWDVPAALRFVVEEDDAKWVLRLEGSSPCTLDFHSVLTAETGCDYTNASCLIRDNWSCWGKCGKGNCKQRTGEIAVVERVIPAGLMSMAFCCS